MKPATLALSLLTLFVAAPSLAMPAVQVAQAVIDPPVIVPNEHDLRSTPKPKKRVPGADHGRFDAPVDWSPTDQELIEIQQSHANAPVNTVMSTPAATAAPAATGAATASGAASPAPSGAPSATPSGVIPIAVPSGQVAPRATEAPGEVPPAGSPGGPVGAPPSATPPVLPTPNLPAVPAAPGVSVGGPSGI